MTELLSASSESTAAVAATDTGGEPVEAIRPQVLAIARAAKVASRVLATLPRARKDAALHAMADALVAATAEILAANAVDLERGRSAGMAAGLLDRLALDPGRIAGIAAALRDLAALPDPVGEVVRGSTLPNGLRLRQLRVPMGVVGMIYEARPNVTVDAAGLALKSGNAVILRGGSAAASSNEVIVGVLSRALEAQGLPGDAVQSIDRFGRAGGVALMQARGVVDVLLPGGGADLIQTVIRESSVPVSETGVGNCHVYVDAAAELDMALAITMNSKTHRVGVCNAAETLLVHAHIAETFLPVVLREAAQDHRQEGLGNMGVDQQRLRRVAHPDPMRLGVHGDGEGHVQLRRGVDIHMAVADPGLDHRHARLADDGLDQVGPTPRHEDVDHAARLHERHPSGAAEAVDRLDGVAGQALGLERP